MARYSSPSIRDISQLKNAPHESELEVVKFFDRFLDESWEVYFNPHLNGLRPDIVLLHPRVGLAVFEIKDWDLNKYHRDDSGKLYCFGQNSAKVYVKDPVDQVQSYKNELINLYLPSLNSAYQAQSVITAGIIFTNSDQRNAHNLFSCFLMEHYGGNSELETVLRYNPISGVDSLKSTQMSSIFPEYSRHYSKYMNTKVYQELKNWLVEPSMPRDQRTPLDIMLDSTQKKLIEDKKPAKFRRIKGPAGSGKSVILAARAAELAMQNKDVLVVSFNITLRNYLQDLAVRWKRTNGKIRHQVTWMNFHYLCKRSCYQYGYQSEYKLLWADKESALQESLANLVNQIEISDEDKFDAILVDEGQDFRLSWWNLLRNKFLKDDGEMLLVADSTQDIYETAKAWTEEAMNGAGFRGKWNELSISYRLPSSLLKIVQDFANTFLSSETRIIPQPRQKDVFEDESTVLNWVQTETKRAEEVIIKSVLDLIEYKGRHSIAVSDITVLVPTNDIGVEVVKKLGAKGVRVINTFKILNDTKQRNKKLAFYMGDASIKATTIHSFKGWESKALVIYIGPSNTEKDLALFYTSITRLKIDYGETSFLTVVSDNPALIEFGKTWPNYYE